MHITRALLIGLTFAIAAYPQEPLPAPGFHHLHLNSTDPAAAIDFYTKQFPSTSKSTWAGLPSVKAGNVYILFNKVATPPALLPQTAIWHFGFHSTDERASLKRYQEIGTKVLPLYTGDADRFVYINSDFWPGAGGPGGALGRTRSQRSPTPKPRIFIPPAEPEFSYIAGPDGAIIEYLGNQPVERFNHVHMYQDDPFCAQLWYRQHLNAPATGRGPQYTQDDCKQPRGERSWPALEKEGMYRVPSAGVTFSDVALNWYINQGESPLAPTRGHLADHFALSVANLDAWIAKLEKENVKILRETYRLGDTRAVMIEGPSREAIELVEIK